jgi:hypothetical protein
MSVCISGSEFVMDVLCHRKRRQREKKTDEAYGKSSRKPLCWKRK